MAHPDEVLDAWFRTCQTAEFIPESVVKDFAREFRRKRMKRVMRDTLRPFTKARCPGCGLEGRFRVRGLGRLTHPGCGTWHMRPETYAFRVAGEALRLAPQVAATILTATVKPKPQQPPEPRGPVCAGCGADFPENKQFCPRCGRRRAV